MQQMGLVPIAGQGFLLPRWLRDGLNYASLVAPAAVVALEVVKDLGLFLATWQNSGPAGALAGLFLFAWKRSLFGTILVGTLTMPALKIRAGWP